MKTNSKVKKGSNGLVAFNAVSEHGRCCLSCGEYKSWNDFSSKNKGVNGKDSRCKACVAEIKKNNRRSKLKSELRSARYKQQHILVTNVVGILTNQILETTGTLIGGSISELIEKGNLT